MSGIEVVGLTLGAFPLLISALEGTRKGYSQFQSWWKIQYKYKKFLNAVKVQQTIFQVNLESLLRTLVYDDEELRTLIENPGGAEWLSEDLERRLKGRLPVSHGAYIATMEAMNEALRNLQTELGANKDGFQKRVAAEKAERQQRPLSKATVADVKETMQYQTFRISFISRTQEREKLLEEVVQGNVVLKRFSEELPRQSRPIERRRGRRAAMSASLFGYWQHAKDLYRLIQEASHCSCSASHHAHLALQQYRKDQGVEFEVLFTYEKNIDITCRAQNAWDWKETRITLEPRTRPATPSQAGPQSLAIDTFSATNHTETSLARSSRKSHGTNAKSTKTVSWAESTIESTVQMALLPMKPTSKSPKIHDLCATIANQPPDCSCLGVLENGKNAFSVKVPAQQRLPKTTLQYITLQEMLAGRGRLTLHRRQRYQIALAVASAYLQLHASPWLGVNWDRKDIHFLFDPATSLLYEEPRVTRDFVTPQSQATTDHSIGALGITLLELVFDKVLEKYENYSKYLPAGGSDEWSDLITAKQWCVGHAINEDEDFANVIQWCLNNSPTRTIMDEDDDRAWRRELFDNVVEPLTFCCRKAFP